MNDQDRVLFAIIDQLKSKTGNAPTNQWDKEINDFKEGFLMLVNKFVDVTFHIWILTKNNKYFAQCFTLKCGTLKVLALR